jgi:hypothetical protein
MDDILNSWKEISTFVGRDVGTCIKWSRELGLPVYHIDRNSPRSSVFAYKSEIEKWFKARARL